uniref:Uncharacterized protein n=1 Tax=uncultured marine virus TaxID=186617 RepID=A0A0F7L9M6_9VIRU|nr:hypothetical protein [uncultured marine virus]
MFDIFLVVHTRRLRLRSSLRVALYLVLYVHTSRLRLFCCLHCCIEYSHRLS